MSGFSRFVRLWQSGDGFRERVNADRKKKYHENAEVKKAKQEASRSRYQPKGRTGRGPNKSKTIEHEGATVVLIGLGEAARRLGITKTTLRAYDEQRIIPRNRVTDDRAPRSVRRWYPEAFIEFLKPLLVDQGRRREPLWSLKRRVEDAWTAAIGIPKLPEETTHDSGETGRIGEGAGDAGGDRDERVDGDDAAGPETRTF